MEQTKGTWQHRAMWDLGWIPEHAKDVGEEISEIPTALLVDSLMNTAVLGLTPGIELLWFCKVVMFRKTKNKRGICTLNKLALSLKLFKIGLVN